MQEPAQSTPAPDRSRFWQPLAIGLVVLVGYGIAPARLPLVGEETCRAQHGIEMAASGDWLVATNQGLSILDRPPLHYWILASIEQWVHHLDPTTLRLLMALVTLATSLLIWSYARRFLNSTGAFLAGLAYPTMGHVFDLGRRAETDAFFTLLVAASLMVWHAGYLTGGRWKAWVAGGAIAGAAALTKGTQAPLAFFGTIYCFLLLRRDWRWLVHPAHLAGILAFAALIAIWQAPFYMAVGWEGTRMSWFDSGAERFTAEWGRYATGIVGFPFKMLGACLPWTLLLVGLWPAVRRGLDSRSRSCLLFALLGCATIAGPVWISTYGRPRFAMSAYPLLAVLCGLMAQQCTATAAPANLRKLWRLLFRAIVSLIAALAVVSAVASLGALFSDAPWTDIVAQPWWLVVGTLAAVLLGGRVVWRTVQPPNAQRPQLATFVSAMLLALCFNGVILNIMSATAVEIGPEVVKLRQSLPADARLVSFHLLHHKFVYWYEEPIPILPWPETAEDLPADVTYFAVHLRRGEKLDLPFSWEEFAVLNMDRRKKEKLYDWVLVGRRLPE